MRAGASLALATTAMLGLAAAPAARSADHNSVRGGVYAVEPAHTQVMFSVDHLGFSTFSGEFTGASGRLTLDPADMAATTLEVTVPVASVATSVPKLDSELKGGQWLNAAAYPTMTFRSTRVVPTGPDTADVDGELTLHGATHPVLLKARFHGSGVNPLSHAFTTGFDVTGVIRRSEFGVRTYVPMISDDVTLTIHAAFEKAP